MEKLITFDVLSSSMSQEVRFNKLSIVSHMKNYSIKNK